MSRILEYGDSPDTAAFNALNPVRPATPRKPRVDPLIPTHQIDRRLATTHVSTPDNAITMMIETAIDQHPDPRWTPALKRQAVRYALWRHHRNLAEALAVGLR